jgi:hypothetical protein
MDEALHAVHLTLPRSRPLTAASLPLDCLASLGISYRRTLLPGLLRTLGAVQPCWRYPLAVPTARAPQILDRLQKCFVEAAPDPCVIISHGCRSSDASGDSGDTYDILLLAEDQLACVRDMTGPQRRYLLPTGQLISAAAQSEKPGRKPHRLPPPYGAQYPAFPGTKHPDGQFHAISPAMLPQAPNRTYAFLCLLHPTHRPTFGSGMIMLRNPELETRYPGLVARFPILVEYRDSLDQRAAALDEKILLTVGLRWGDMCELQPLNLEAPRLSRWLFTYRHTLCRVTYASTTDQEKPFARMPAEVFDVLGVQSGARVVVEGLSQEEPSRGVRRVVLRGLEKRQDPLPQHSNMPDYFAEVGSVDLPSIALDLASRRALGVSAGSAVYVRPAFRSALLVEVSSVFLLLAAALVGTIAQSNWALGIAICILYLSIVIVMAASRFR